MRNGGRGLDGIKWMEKDPIHRFIARCTVPSLHITSATPRPTSLPTTPQNRTQNPPRAHPRPAMFRKLIFLPLPTLLALALANTTFHIGYTEETGNKITWRDGQDICANKFQTLVGGKSRLLLHSCPPPIPH
jgi:hypothetical protein